MSPLEVSGETSLERHGVQLGVDDVQRRWDSDVPAVVLCAGNLHRQENYAAAERNLLCTAQGGDW